MRHGFGVTIVEPVRGDNAAVYSSTHIRELLRAGKPREAAAQLGRPWEIDGRVATGDRRGRTIGFPTVNIALGDYLRPLLGVYAVRVSGDGAEAELSLAWLPVERWRELLAEAGFTVEGLYGWFDRTPYAGHEDSIWVCTASPTRTRPGSTTSK